MKQINLTYDYDVNGAGYYIDIVNKNGDAENISFSKYKYIAIVKGFIFSIFRLSKFNPKIY